MQDFQEYSLGYPGLVPIHSNCYRCKSIETRPGCTEFNMQHMKGVQAKFVSRQKTALE